MEVHAHTHTARKKWTHYLWEFFMLFLAVTLGFFVENQREHLVEHRREKQFMKTLLEDIQNDIVDLKNDTAFWELQFRRIDTIQKEIRKPDGQRDQLLLYINSGYMRWYEKFTYHDRTISQLKNGGNFRLIRNAAVADSLIDYDAHISTSLKDMETISNNLWQNLNYLQNKIFNTEYYSMPLQPFNIDSAVKINREPIQIKKGSDNEIFEYFNLLDYFRGLNMARNMEHYILLRKAYNLVTLLKKEYHLN